MLLKCCCCCYLLLVMLWQEKNSLLQFISPLLSDHCTLTIDLAHVVVRHFSIKANWIFEFSTSFMLAFPLSLSLFKLFVCLLLTAESVSCLEHEKCHFRLYIFWSVHLTSRLFLKIQQLFKEISVGQIFKKKFYQHLLFEHFSDSPRQFQSTKAIQTKNIQN